MNTTIRNIFASLLISASIIGSVAFFATPAAALSAHELQIQIQDLLAKVAALQEQLRVALANEGNQNTQSDISVTAVPRICKEIPVRGLGLGVRGEDVRGLQEFLRSEGFLGAEATGYFGSQTRAALSAWQSNGGIQAVGSFGPLSRERIRIWCANRNTLSVSPTNGQAPLTVVVTSRVGDQGPTRPSSYDAQDVVIDFGDGSERQWVQCETIKNDQFGGETNGGTCRNPASYKHTYAQNGSYTVRLLKAGGMCMGGCPETVLGSAYVMVGAGPVACTKEYMPVCGSKPVVCITAPCNPVQQTYGNRCMMNADGATYLHDGQCRNDSMDPAADPRCKSWYDGCNSCSRSEPGGQAMCTLRACITESMTKPYCTAYFDGSTGNRPPTISAFSGPTTLSSNQAGTWTIRASDPENQSISYSITWGDEFQTNTNTGSGSAPARESFVQTATFTHTYTQPGTYTVVVVVRDASGQESKSSSTVSVGSGGVACTMEYAPVCGRPTGCANTCPPGMYCAAVCRLHEPQTYGNRCMLNASGAEFLHEGQCTAGSGNWY